MAKNNGGATEQQMTKKRDDGAAINKSARNDDENDGDGGATIKTLVSNNQPMKWKRDFYSHGYKQERSGYEDHGTTHCTTNGMQ